MRPTGRMTDVQRATEVLHGVLAGLTIDYSLEDAEVAELASWLQLHRNLLERQPFAELRRRLDLVLEDGRIDEVEREELLEFCQTYLDLDSLAVVCSTTAVRRLHGVLHGIAADGVVTEQETHDLHDWLVGYAHFKDQFPFDGVWKFVERALADGHVDEQEQAELLAYCRDFSERPAKDPAIHAEYDPSEEPWMISEAPILQTIDGVCAKGANVVVDGRTFCFTGQAATGKRADLNAMLKAKGGEPASGVKFDLDYLVIGANSQPCWVFSTYGRKVEKVLKYQKQGSRTLILRESDFVAAMTTAT